MRRVLTALLLVGVTCLQLPPVHAAGSAPFTRTDFTLAGADGVKLAASLWVPAGNGPFPAMIETNGWINRHDNGTELEFAEHFAKAGYVVLGFTSRGWGNSEGEIELDGPHEQNDTRAAVDYLAKTDKVLLDGPGDPRVGMVGQSYGGGIQVLTAQGEPRIDAIIPHITWSNLLDSLAPQDVAKLGWISELYASGQTVGRGVPLAGHPGNADGNGPSEKLSEWYAHLLAENAPTDEMRTEIGQVRSLHPGKLHTPTLLIQGWGDTLFVPYQALATFHDLQASNGTARLILYPGGHGITLPNTDPAWLKLYPVMDDFLNVTLRHKAPTLPPYPVMRYRYDEKDYVGELQWPPANTTTWTGYFAGTSLDADATKATGSFQVVNPILPFTCTDPSNYQDKASFCPYDQPGAFQVLAGKPFDTPQEVTGTPTAHLVISSTQLSDVRLFLTLVDVDAAGKADPILRQVVPIHLASATSATPVDVTLETITRTLAKGHSIGLHVSTTEALFAGSRVPGAITVSSSKEAPSWVTVPLVPKDAWGDHEAPKLDIRVLHTDRFLIDAYDNLGLGNVTVTFNGQPLAMHAYNATGADVRDAQRGWHAQARWTVTTQGNGTLEVQATDLLGSLAVDHRAVTPTSSPPCDYNGPHYCDELFHETTSAAKTPWPSASVFIVLLAAILLARHRI